MNSTRFNQPASRVRQFIIRNSFHRLSLLSFLDFVLLGFTGAVHLTHTTQRSHNCIMLLHDKHAINFNVTTNYCIMFVCFRSSLFHASFKWLKAIMNVKMLKINHPWLCVTGTHTFVQQKRHTRFNFNLLFSCLALSLIFSRVFFPKFHRINWQ